jgi:hypothetical protein
MERTRAIVIKEQRQLLTLGFAILVFMFALLALNLRDYGTRLRPNAPTIGDTFGAERVQISPATVDQGRGRLPVNISMRSH